MEDHVLSPTQIVVTVSFVQSGHHELSCWPVFSPGVWCSTYTLAFSQPSHLPVFEQAFPSSLETRPSKNRKGGSGKWAGVKCTLHPICRLASDWLLISILMCVYWNWIEAIHTGRTLASFSGSPSPGHKHWSFAGGEIWYFFHMSSVQGRKRVERP